MAISVKEYWIIDHFQHTMTVYNLRARKVRKRVIRKDQTYKTDLVPGFELPLVRLFALTDRWPSED